MQTDIAIADRALQYGDGCFTTIAYRNSQLEHFDAHIKRLKKACQVLFIEFEAWHSLIASVHQSLKQPVPATADCVIKIIISRGQGGRGYSPQGCDNPNFIISQHVMPSHYQQWQSAGIPLTISPIKLAKQPLLAGIKHLNRLEQVLIKQALLATDYLDALVCDTENILIESSIANVFWYENNTWFTPSVNDCGVAGVMRQTLLDVFKTKGVIVKQTQRAITDLAGIEEMFLCNSLMKVVPVTHIQTASSKEIQLFNKNTQVKMVQEWLVDFERQKASQVTAEI